MSESPVKSWLSLSTPYSGRQGHGSEKQRRSTWGADRSVYHYVFVLVLLGVLTLILWNVGWLFNRVNIAMLYLLPVLYSALRFGRGPAFFAASLGVVLFDFFFVPPVLNFSVSDFRYLISFNVFLMVAGLTATLASRLRAQLKEATRREEQTSILYRISRQMVSLTDLASMIATLEQQVSNALHMPVVIVLPQADGRMVVEKTADHAWLNELDQTFASWAFHHGQMCGRGTEYFKEAAGLYLPLKTEANVYGVLCIHIGLSVPSLDLERMTLVEALSSLAAISIARFKLEEEAKVAHLAAESERLRTVLLDSISHELRTPLASIIGAATGILEGEGVLDVADHRELIATLRAEAVRMNRLVTNLLNMVRLESGMMRLRKQWCDIEDLIGVALHQLRESLAEREVTVDLPDDLPGVHVDSVLIEHVLVNVLSNAIKYSPEKSEIALHAYVVDHTMRVAIKDQGMGIATEERARIFEKFYRSPRNKHITGTGLGLAICKGIALAHGGDIWVEAADSVGSTLVLSLPLISR